MIVLQGYFVWFAACLSENSLACPNQASPSQVVVLLNNRKLTNPTSISWAFFNCLPCRHQHQHLHPSSRYHHSLLRCDTHPHNMLEDIKSDSSSLNATLLTQHTAWDSSGSSGQFLFAPLSNDALLVRVQPDTRTESNGICKRHCNRRSVLQRNLHHSVLQ